MEKHKARYFESFVQRAKINLKKLESSIREMEDSIQRCYVETVHHKSDDFVKLIRLDASFILELFLRYYEEKWEVDDPMFMKNTNVEVQHFTDLLKFFHLPPSNKLPYKDTKLTSPKYSATQLREAGVTFKDTTEALIQNIMALEQCDYRRQAYITDFYLMLDHLINTSEDVDLLSDEGIIDNRLGDSNAVTAMISNLNKGIFRRDMNSDY
uniref:Uncharacterized protein n=1 Tax=Quercus lobata TaxID=97700 RepID=A0A7N2RAA7_QUELO